MNVILSYIAAIQRLERQFGLRDNVLEWFRSCLSDRTFRVMYGGNASRTVIILAADELIALCALSALC